MGAKSSKVAPDSTPDDSASLRKTVEALKDDSASLRKTVKALNNTLESLQAEKGGSPAAWRAQANNSTTHIPACPLTADGVDASIIGANRRAFVAERCRQDYKQAGKVFELILASVAYDNAGVVWVVNELRDRMVKLVREVAELELRESTSAQDQDPAAYVANAIIVAFGNASGGGFAAFGDDAASVNALLEDGTRSRLREKLGVCCNQCERMCAALDAIGQLLPASRAELTNKSAEAGDEDQEMAGWAESRLALQLGLDLEFVSARRVRYLEAVEKGEATPLGPEASLWDGWVLRWSRRGEIWTRRQGEFREKTATDESVQASQPVIDEAFLTGLDLALSAPERSFSHVLASKRKAAAAAEGKNSLADPEAEVVNWMTGDLVWSIVGGCDLEAAAEAACLGLRASSSGTTFTLLTLAQYLGTLASGVDCWSSMLPPDFTFCVPSGPTVTRESFNAEVRREMEGKGDIQADLLATTKTEYANDFAKYRSVWPAHWLSVQRQKELSVEFDADPKPKAAALKPKASVPKAAATAGIAPTSTQYLVADSVFRKLAGPTANAVELSVVTKYLLGRGDMTLEVVQDIVSKLDANSDGSIDKEEWRVGFTAGLVAHPAADLAGAAAAGTMDRQADAEDKFLLADTSGDGYVDEDELLVLVRDILKGSNGSGRQLPSDATLRAFLQTFRTEADTPLNLSFDDFVGVYNAIGVAMEKGQLVEGMDQV